MSEKFVNIIIDKEKDSKFLVSDKNINTADLSIDRHTSIAKINIKDKVTTVCRYEDGESKGMISLNIGLEQIKIDSENKIEYINNDIRDLARLYGINLQQGQAIEEKDLRDLCKILAKIMISTIHQNNYSWGFSRMIVNGGDSFEQELFIPRIIIFSGISSKYVFDKEQNVFGDGNIGMLLYQEISNYEL